MTTINYETVATSQGTVIDLRFSSLDEAKNIVEAFRTSQANQVSEDRNKAANLKVASRKHLYDNLGAFYGIAVTLLDPANDGFLAEVLREHGLQKAEARRNPFGPLVALMFGQWYDIEFTDSKGKKKKRKVPETATITRTRGGVPQRYFVPNRSAEKYAKVARFARSKGWKPDEFADRMLAFKGGMAGILKADTDSMRGGDQDLMDAEELVQLVLGLPAHTVLDTMSCGIGAKDSQRRFVGLWAEIVDDEVHIRGTLPTSETAIEAFVEKYAKDNAAKLWKQKAMSGMGNASQAVV